MIVLLAITAGFYLSGIVGAILALPVAGAAQIIIRHLRAFRAVNGQALDGASLESPAVSQPMAMPANDQIAET